MAQAHEFLRNFCLSNPQNQALLHKHLDLFLTPGVSGFIDSTFQSKQTIFDVQQMIDYSKNLHYYRYLRSSVIRSVFDLLLNVLIVFFSFTGWPRLLVRTSNQLEQQNYDQYYSNDSVYARFPSWGNLHVFPHEEVVACFLRKGWLHVSCARVGCMFPAQGLVACFSREGWSHVPARGLVACFPREGWLHVSHC